MTVDILHFYASQLGWPLFPCSNHTKAPLTAHGFKDASLDLGRIEEWYRQYPGCAWGTPTSAERGVIDIDPRNGGTESLARLEAQHGAMPLTPKVLTGGGGFHYWLRCPPGTKSGKVADGIDRKAEGGYVILPPSRIDLPEHEGRAYAWEVRPWDGVPLAEAPAWGLAVHAAEQREAQAADPWVVREASADLLSHPGSPEGERRRTLCRLAGVHLARGDSESTIYALAEAWAERCQPPFDEWRKHVDGLLRKEEAKGLRMTTPSAPDPYRVQVGITEERADTLEPGREQTNSAASAGAELVPSLPRFGDSGQAGELVPSLPRFGDSAVLSAIF